MTAFDATSKHAISFLQHYEESVPCLRTYLETPGQLSTKIGALVRHLQAIHAHNCELAQGQEPVKSVVFCEWHAEMNLIQSALMDVRVGGRAMRVGTYHGGMRADEKDIALKRFRMREGVHVLLIQMRCGAEGLNLQVAQHVFIMNPTWTPCRETQAIGRVMRIGRQGDVHVVRFVMSDTVDQQCLDIQQRKLQLVMAAMADASMVARLGGTFAALTDEDIRVIIEGNVHGLGRRTRGASNRRWSHVLTSRGIQCSTETGVTGVPHTTGPPAPVRAPQKRSAAADASAGQAKKKQAHYMLNDRDMPTKEEMMHQVEVCRVQSDEVVDDNVSESVAPTSAHRERNPYC